MRIIQITPGAGAMYCGNCFRDNALVKALRRLGHEASMVPLYLPLTLDEEDQSAGTPIFFSGINVYLQQKSALFREVPSWFHDLFTKRSLLKWAAGKAANTRAEDLGEITLSILRGEEGNQERELDELADWLATQPKPDVICLSNVLLIGLARRLKQQLNAPVVCMLQGEDSFLDALPETHRALCWQTISQRADDVALFIAPSHYFGELMTRRLGLAPDHVSVVYNGIDLEGYASDRRAASEPPSPATRHPSPYLGYFARMCREKGLDTLVEAYVLLRQRDKVKDLKLRIGGACGPGDEPFVKSLQEKLQAQGLAAQVEFCPNLDRAGKLAFLKSLSSFSVPARYGEAFGLYVIEALAAGVPVIQPRTAAFPELIEATGGGVLFEPGDPNALAAAVEELLMDTERVRTFGAAGRKSVLERFNAESMAQGMVSAFESCLKGSMV